MKRLGIWLVGAALLASSSHPAPGQTLWDPVPSQTQYVLSSAGYRYGALRVDSGAGAGHLSSTLDLQEDWGSDGLYTYRHQLDLDWSSAGVTSASGRSWGSGLATETLLRRAGQVEIQVRGEGEPWSLTVPEVAEDLVMDDPWVPYAAVECALGPRPGPRRLLVPSSGQVLPATLEPGPVESEVRDGGIVALRRWTVRVGDRTFVEFWREEATGRLARLSASDGSEFVRQDTEAPLDGPLPRATQWAAELGNAAPLSGPLPSLKLELALRTTGPALLPAAWDRDGYLVTVAPGPRDAQGTATVTIDVRKSDALSQAALGFTCEAPLSMPAVPFLEIEDPRIRESAVEATQGARDRREALDLVARWVASQIRPAVTRPSARRALAIRAADFRGKALLGAAQLRSVGIPARPARGLVLDEDGRTLRFRHWIEAEVAPGLWEGADSETGLHVRLGEDTIMHGIRALAVQSGY